MRLTINYTPVKPFEVWLHWGINNIHVTTSTETSYNLKLESIYLYVTSFTPHDQRDFPDVVYTFTPQINIVVAYSYTVRKSAILLHRFQCTTTLQVYKSTALLYDYIAKRCALHARTPWQDTDFTTNAYGSPCSVMN